MSLISRGLAAIALAAAGIAVPAPALAAPQLTVFLPNVLVGEDSPGKTVRINVGASELVTATNTKFELDWSAVAGVVTVTQRFSTGFCSTSGSVMTCSYPHDSPTSIALPEMVVKPVPGVGAGATGKWKAKLSADGLATAGVEATISVAEAIDLAVPQPDITLTSTPGGAAPQTLEIDNIGERAADGVVAVIFGDYAFVTTKQYSNCTYNDGRLRSCTFDEQLAPGAGYMTSEPIPFGLRTDTMAPFRAFLDVEWMTKADFEVFKQEWASIGLGEFFGQPGTGSRLNLKERLNAAANRSQTEIDPSDNFLSLTVEVEGDNDADLAVFGGSASGAVGQVVTVAIGIKNLGPATSDHGRVGGFATLDVALPQGSSLAEMPVDCFAMKGIGDNTAFDPDRGNLAARFIRCEHPSSLFITGTQITFPVKLRIDQVIASASGPVTLVTSECDGCRQDKNPSNDTAAIVLNGPSLPTTGVQTGLVAGTGALLAFAGAVMLFLTRRRPKRVNT